MTRYSKEKISESKDILKKRQVCLQTSLTFPILLEGNIYIAMTIKIFKSQVILNKRQVCVQRSLAFPLLPKESYLN